MIYEPYPYQQYCAARIVADAAVGLFLDMGLGKTVITLDAINTLRYDRWAVQRVLIIAPKKVAREPGQRRRRSGNTCGTCAYRRCWAVSRNVCGRLPPRQTFT